MLWLNTSIARSGGNNTSRGACCTPSAVFLAISYAFVLFCLIVPQYVLSTVYVDPMKHDVQVITQQNFNAKVQKFRDNFVAVLYGYNKSEKSKKFIQGELNSLAKDLKGMITVGAVDCGEWVNFCKQPMIKQEPPVLLVYPPEPFPPFVYDGEMTKDKIMKRVLALIPSNHVRLLTKENVDVFLTEHISMPKVLLFSEKPKPPALYNALANSFDKKLGMGFVDVKNENSTALVSRWNVKKFPHLMVVKNDRKTEVYKGEMKFRNLHDWLNIYSETFVLGGGFSDVKEVQSARPWLVQKVPELTKASHKDVCFAKGKGLCVIYLKNNSPMSDEEINMISSLANEFTSHLADRGTTFRWMWMDVGTEKHFAELFNVSGFPSVVVFNPYKRLRFTKHEDEAPATKERIEALINKIAGGDARFTNVPKDKLIFVDREDTKKEGEAKKAGKRDEL